MYFLVRKDSKGPLAREISSGYAVLAFPTEDLAYYCAARAQHPAFRRSRALGLEKVRVLPWFDSFDRAIILDSFEAIDRLYEAGPDPAPDRIATQVPWQHRSPTSTLQGTPVSRSRSIRTLLARRPRADRSPDAGCRTMGCAVGFTLNGRCHN